MAVGRAGAPSRGEITRPAHKSIEDRAVDEAVAQQEEAGLTVLTDGARCGGCRSQSQMEQAVEGFGEWDLGIPLARLAGHDEIGDCGRERSNDLSVAAPLCRQRSLSAEEFVYLRAALGRCRSSSRFTSAALLHPGRTVHGRLDRQRRLHKAKTRRGHAGRAVETHSSSLPDTTCCGGNVKRRRDVDRP